MVFLKIKCSLKIKKGSKMGFTENDRKGLVFKLEKHIFLLSVARNKEAKKSIQKKILEIKEDIKSIS